MKYTKRLSSKFKADASPHISDLLGSTYYWSILVYVTDRWVLAHTVCWQPSKYKLQYIDVLYCRLHVLYPCVIVCAVKTILFNFFLSYLFLFVLIFTFTFTFNFQFKIH